jgi:hypothetical protein
MKCPTCPDATLVMADRQGVEIHYSPRAVATGSARLASPLANANNPTATAEQAAAAK